LDSVPAAPEDVELGAVGHHLDDVRLCIVLLKECIERSDLDGKRFRVGERRQFRLDRRIEHSSAAGVVWTGGQLDCSVLGPDASAVDGDIRVRIDCWFDGGPGLGRWFEDEDASSVGDVLDGRVDQGRIDRTDDDGCISRLEDERSPRESAGNEPSWRPECGPQTRSQPVPGVR